LPQWLLELLQALLGLEKVLTKHFFKH